MNRHLLNNHTHTSRRFGAEVSSFCAELRSHHVPHHRNNIRVIRGAVYLEIGKGAIRYFTKENALRFLLQGGKHRLNVAKRLLSRCFRLVHIFGLQLYEAL